MKLTTKRDFLRLRLWRRFGFGGVLRFGVGSARINGRLPALCAEWFSVVLARERSFASR